MSSLRIAKTALVCILYVATCGIAAVKFATWMPWLACKPLTDLPNEEFVVTLIPADAHCYSIDHGQLLFSSYETVAENPAPFAATVAISVALLGLAVWPRLWNGLWSWARGGRRGRR